MSIGDYGNFPSGNFVINKLSPTYRVEVKGIYIIPALLGIVAAEIAGFLLMRWLPE